MNEFSLYPLLKSVSRSFYLTLRVLPSNMRQPISIAYLLARSADSVTDNNIFSTDEKIDYLNQLKSALINIVNQPDAERYSNQLNHLAEKRLVSSQNEIIRLYSTLSNSDKKAIKKVIDTLLEGMAQDIRYFSDESSALQYKATPIKALADDKSLDEYTYLVAGCVGEFWTALSISHIPALKHWSEGEMSKRGIEFGKALQLTNIVRDVAKDYALGRCYLPITDLQSHHLTIEMMDDKHNNSKFEPIYNKWIARAETYYESSEIYFLSIPKKCYRLRLAVLWPILIGLATLNKIKRKKNLLDRDNEIKVTRTWVYKMLLISLLGVFSNSFIQHWIKRLKK